MGKSELILALCLGFLGLCNAIESPQYTVVHSESDFEIRLYREAAWMSAPVKDISFVKATRLGFHRKIMGQWKEFDWGLGFSSESELRLFQYIQGANLNFSRIAMTAPVLTSIVPEAGPLHSSAYFVRLYLPVKFQASPPLPLPELNLKPFAWTGHCIAVRTFSGFARDWNIVKEAEKLSISLSRSPWANSTSSGSSYAYSIAQYNSPFRIIGRVNEVWVDIEAPGLDGCISTGVASY
ncbi:Heme-binding protein 2 [Morella rubra]|uniref:Heme-binding protein 2 n=1 Tax=Morella rubra TaxID=262757 RepID=A0A6A1UKA4_9ROSI|nr:Heme-binding protein 2 [Morella rubra]